MINVIDNFLPAADWERCLDYFKGGNWQFPPLSGQTNKTCVWRIFNPSIEATIGNILYNRLRSLDIPPLAVKRVGINGATTFNESHCHIDGPLGDYSLVWFGSSKWESSWDGRLRVFHDEECWKTAGMTKKPDIARGVTKIEYIPNRAILFPAHLAHIPETPSIDARNNLRTSVGLHLTPANEWNYIYIPRNNNGYI